jgi:hypothetical protein
LFVTEPETDWENVPPDEWPFVYLIHQPGEYLIDGEVTYRDLYGTIYSTEPLDFKVTFVSTPAKMSLRGAFAQLRPRPNPGTRRSFASIGPAKRRVSSSRSLCESPRRVGQRVGMSPEWGG